TVVLFSTKTKSWRKGLVAASPANRTSLGRFLKQRRAVGGTNLWGGIEAAFELEDADTFFLLSDGQPSTGSWTSYDDIVRETQRANRTRRVTIHCVSLGVDSALLKELAAQSGGVYVRR
ncbi:MAG: hypothetical protein OER88_05505, partial [Planctomycetota bacterium]|nr:hypothetical protein [Planctomycetota bacterium]